MLEWPLKPAVIWQFRLGTCAPIHFSVKVKGKSVPLGARGAQRVPGSSQITVQWPKMVVRLSALRTGRFLPPVNTPGTHLC